MGQQLAYHGDQAYPVILPEGYVYYGTSKDAQSHNYNHEA
jgi:hypothetical protein